MFSLALKNAILLVLIILILHILIKNYLVTFHVKPEAQLTFEELVVSPPPPQAPPAEKEDILKKDENELYSFLFSTPVQAQPQPQQGALLSSMDLGTISKFGDYAMV
jgi:hypothetical protein